MLTHFFTSLFYKRCPLCRKEVHEQSKVAVQRFGQWFCSEQHADIHELNLYDALYTAYHSHAAFHGGHVPLPEAMAMSFSPCHRRKLAHLEPHQELCASTCA
jgi:hypothetical protein